MIVNGVKREENKYTHTHTKSDKQTHRENCTRVYVEHSTQPSSCWSVCVCVNGEHVRWFCVYCSISKCCLVLCNVSFSTALLHFLLPNIFLDDLVYVFLRFLLRCLQSLSLNFCMCVDLSIRFRYGTLRTLGKGKSPRPL